MSDEAAFVMKLPGLCAEERARIMEWGQKRFHRFRCNPDGLAGGVFKRPPRSLKALQQLVGKNLANWGIERENIGDRGWLRLCCKGEFRTRLMGHEISERWRRLAAAALEKATKGEVRKMNNRRRVIKEKIKQAKKRRMAEVFAALAAGVQQRKQEDEERRSAKTKLLNQQRFGLAVTSPSYTAEELDQCESWAAVLARRVNHPRSVRKELDDKAEIRAETEKAQQQAGPVVFLGPART